jgi:hypothetical protein
VQLRRRADRVFGIRAGAERDVVARDVNAIAVLKAGYVGADRLDFAGAVGARHVRQRGLARVGAAADVPIHRVDAGSMHADQDFTRSRLRGRPLFDPHHVGAAELTNDNRAHDARCYHEKFGC